MCVSVATGPRRRRWQASRATRRAPGASEHPAPPRPGFRARIGVARVERAGGCPRAARRAARAGGAAAGGRPGRTARARAAGASALEPLEPLPPLAELDPLDPLDPGPRRHRPRRSSSSSSPLPSWSPKWSRSGRRATRRTRTGHGACGHRHGGQAAAAAAAVDHADAAAVAGFPVILGWTRRAQDPRAAPSAARVDGIYARLQLVRLDDSIAPATAAAAAPEGAHAAVAAGLADIRRQAIDARHGRADAAGDARARPARLRRRARGLHAQRVGGAGLADLGDGTGGLRGGQVAVAMPSAQTDHATIRGLHGTFAALDQASSSRDSAITPTGKQAQTGADRSKDWGR